MPKFIATVSLLLAIFSSSTEAIECPEDWINGGELGCFHFAIHSGPVDWENALLHCAEEGGSLAEIPNEATQKFLEEEASANHSEYHFWLGANDYAVEGTWNWLSNNALLEYVDWGTNQPDNSDPRGENCLGFGHDGTWQWNDENCDRNGTPWNGKTFRPLCQLFE